MAGFENVIYKMDSLKSSESLFDDVSIKVSIETINCIQNILTNLISRGNALINKTDDRNEFVDTNTEIIDFNSNNAGPSDKMSEMIFKLLEIQKYESNINIIHNHPLEIKEILGLFKNQISVVKELSGVILKDRAIKYSVDIFIKECKSMEIMLESHVISEVNKSEMNILNDNLSQKIHNFLVLCKKYKNTLRQYIAGMNNKIKSEMELIKQINIVIELSKNIKLESNTIERFRNVCDSTIKYLQRRGKEERKPVMVEEIRYMDFIKNKNYHHHHHTPPSECDYCIGVKLEENEFKTDSEELCDACCAEPEPPPSFTLSSVSSEVSKMENKKDDFKFIEGSCHATKVRKITRINRFLNSDGTIQENKDITTIKELNFNSDPSKMVEFDKFELYKQINNYEIIDIKTEELTGKPYGKSDFSNVNDKDEIIDTKNDKHTRKPDGKVVFNTANSNSEITGIKTKKHARKSERKGVLSTVNNNNENIPEVNVIIPEEHAGTKVRKITRINRFLKSDGTVQENVEVTTIKEKKYDQSTMAEFSEFELSKYYDNFETIDIKTDEHIGSADGKGGPSTVKFLNVDHDKGFTKDAKAKSECILEDFAMIHPTLRDCLSAQQISFVNISQTSFEMSSFDSRDSNGGPS